MDEHDSTRARIIEAAGEVFADKGFADGTVREICQRAGANIAAVNYYFGDKQRLYIEAVKAAHAWRVNQSQIPESSPQTAAEQRLAGFVMAFMRRMLIGDQTWHSRLMLREMLRPDTACAEVVREYIRPEFEALLSIVHDLLSEPDADAVASSAARGEERQNDGREHGVRKDQEFQNKERAHLIAFSIVGQCLHYRVADPVVAKLVDPQEYSGYTPERLAQHVVEFTLRSLGRNVDAVPSMTALAKVPSGDKQRVGIGDDANQSGGELIASEMRTGAHRRSATGSASRSSSERGN